VSHASSPQGSPRPVPKPSFRPANLDDVDALFQLENAAFPSDRLSRRSFRRLIAGPTDELRLAEIDGRPVGYCLVLFRAGTALARLYSIAVHPDFAGQGLGRMLLGEAEAAATARDAIFLRLEVRADNAPAIALYKSAGYRLFGRHEDYYEDGMEALRFEKRLSREIVPLLQPPPYFEQTTDFTCGPCCLMMALAWAKPDTKLDRALELRLWREATTIFMTSGLGGCEPFGLAVTLARRGLMVELRLSGPGPYFLESVRSDEKRTVMRLAQHDFRQQAQMMGIPVQHQALTGAALMEALDQGCVAIVLISGFRMFRKKVPHWVLAYAHDGHNIFIHDPWVEDEDFENQTAAANLPIPIAEFDRMTRYGRQNLRAAVLVHKGIPA